MSITGNKCFFMFKYVNWKDYDYLISVLSVKFYTSTSIQGEEQAMEIEVSIDKFVIDYKDVPHSAFLRVYMVVAEISSENEDL